VPADISKGAFYHRIHRVQNTIKINLIAIYFLLIIQASFKNEFKAFATLNTPDFNIRYL